VLAVVIETVGPLVFRESPFFSPLPVSSYRFLSAVVWVHVLTYLSVLRYPEGFRNVCCMPARYLSISTFSRRKYLLKDDTVHLPDSS